MTRPQPARGTASSPWPALVFSLLLVLLAPLASSADDKFMTFDTLQTRPLALSPNGTKLFVANTPDAQLEIFDVAGDGTLTQAGVVQVGMEPTAVAARNNNEVWVVNFLSDSVSVVDVSSTPPRVIRTLHVGDEPSDVVFAGPVATAPSSPPLTAARTPPTRTASSTPRASDAPISGSSTRTTSAPPSAGTRRRSSPSSATSLGPSPFRTMAPRSTRASIARATRR